MLLNLNYDLVIPTTKSQIIISGLRLPQYFASIREFVTFNLKPNFFFEIFFSSFVSLEFKEPPIYGADVSRSFTDPELDVWNISKLDSILKYFPDVNDGIPLSSSLLGVHS